MKRSKVYRKGKHVYIKSGALTEVRRLSGPDETPFEFGETCRDIYADRFNVETGPKGFLIRFGKALFGTDAVKLKSSIRLDPNTARRFVRALAEALAGQEPKGPKAPAS